MNKRKYKKFRKSTIGQNWIDSQFKALIIKMSDAEKQAMICLMTEHKNGNIDLRDTEKCQNFLSDKVREYESLHNY